MVANFSHSTARSTIHNFPASDASAFRSTMKQSDQKRFVMWIDAVGGFLVCRDDHVLLGQASPANRVDIPLQADVSRRHASIRRDETGYLLLPIARVLLDGKIVTVPTPLADRQEIDLGGAVQLRFRRPHPLSATATLTPISHHRTQPPVDGIVLLANSCVIGPTPSCHVTARQMAGEAVLFEQTGQLFFRGTGPITIDDEEYEKQGPVTEDSRVAGDDFSFSLEGL